MSGGFLTHPTSSTGFFSKEDQGFEYIKKRPVIYNKFSASHLTDEKHAERIKWLEQNQASIFRAIEDPEILERNFRLRDDGFFSSTQIVEVITDSGDERRFLAVAISLSKNSTPSGWHQITTIHPLKFRDIFFSNGDIKPKYVQIK